MITNSTKKYCKEMVNHPYVGIGILPLVGDFAAHSIKVAKALYREEQMNEEEYHDFVLMIQKVEKDQSSLALKSVIAIFKKHSAWEV